MNSPRSSSLFLLSAFGVAAALLLFAPMRNVVLRFVHDDAFYYFGIARRWHALGFSTCDGLTKTNGYHPLWQWLLVPAAGWISDPAIFARVFSAFGALLIVAAAWLMRRRLERDGNPHADLAYYWTAGALAFATIYGMEAPLAAFFFAGTLALIPRSESEWTNRRALALGIVSSLLFLARIDALAGILALDVLLLGTFAETKAARLKIDLAAAIQGLIVFAYFGDNFSAFGDFLPISAALKSARAGWFSFAFPFNFLLLLSIPATIVGAFCFFELWRGPSQNRPLSKQLPLLAAGWLGLADLIAMVQIAAKGSSETYNWYFVPVVLSGAYLFPVAIARYSDRFPKFPIRRAFIVFCLLALAVNLRGKIFKPSNFVDAYDRAVALSKYPPDSLTLASNDCGVLGYFSNQHVFNLDGLTNGYQFQAALAEDRFPEWLDGKDLNACVGPLDPYSGPPRPYAGVVTLTTRRSLYGPARIAHLLVEPMPPPPSAPVSVPIWRVIGIQH